MPLHIPLRPLAWAALLLALPTLGQRPSRSGIGLKLGPQLASQRAAGHNFQPVPGAVLGVYVPLWVAAGLEVQPELLASMQGSSFKMIDGGTITTNTYYLQLPVNAKLYMGNTFNLQGGGYLGHILSANTDGENTTDAFNGWDAGFTLGLGLDMMRGFDITARYVYGMTNMMNEDAVFPTNRCIQLTAGWRLVQFRH